MKPDFSNATIVLIGNFRPDEFLPEALAKAKVIPESEAKFAKFRGLIPGQITQLEFAWGELTVTENRLQIGTNEAPYVRISDFVVKALQDTEFKSEVSQFGINLECHFNLGSIVARDAIGTRVAPPEVWGTWGRKVLDSMKEEDPKKHGGMMVLQMRQRFSEERISGWLDVSVGPSLRIPDNTGVYFRTNHHHQLSAPSTKDDKARQPEQSPENRLAILAFLSERFDGSILAAESIFNEVLST